MNTMMKKPYAIIFSGYGLNCEDETKFAFELAGGRADIIHLNDVIARPALLKKANVLIFGGGFAYGDDTGAGKAYGGKAMLFGIRGDRSRAGEEGSVKRGERRRSSGPPRGPELRRTPISS